ncbi:aromatic ring-hydroxylating dioxygenase subunit alpha [Sandaracinobacter sp. RS1-74]|uniref:aromatic ring-hydroxylating oxygenase subunit alpha n=1 Tax=Sandaracinobacteroides sayramensis TaxID=2913411 RepID=UPI001EDBAA9C|nr:aromatic ring-hydroxylating dioxygenase subunit alpha [Sandaracinobacteroides sayramensis]MCG2840544.1 aromatic ring-hydroxylating dioxygenase subunit alpha [Sandaracinobacteroides sayramensis]
MDQSTQDRIRSEMEWEAARKAPPEGFPALPPIAAARYTDPSFLELEIERIFRRSWLAAIRVEELESSGSFVVWDKVGVPVLIVRGKDDVVRAFHNSCRHRGAAVTPAARGRGSLLRCQYHSWSYDLTGRLVAVPDEQDFCGLDKSANGLIPIRCETWGGWVFVNLDDEAGPLMQQIGPTVGEWGDIDVSTLRVVQNQTSLLDCNWKAALDAFQEVYHINTIHRDSIGKALNSRACSIGLLPGGHSRMVVRYHPWALETLGMDSPDTPSIPGALDMHRDTSTAYFTFPNLVTPIRSIFIQFMQFWPRGVGQCEMQVTGLGPGWGDGPRPDYWDRAAPAFAKVLDEDMANLGSIQRSLSSGALDGVRLSYQERRIYWAHEAIDRAIGADSIPPGLAVSPLLSTFAEQPVATAH